MNEATVDSKYLLTLQNLRSNKYQAIALDSLEDLPSDKIQAFIGAAKELIEQK